MPFKPFSFDQISNEDLAAIKEDDELRPIVNKFLNITHIMENSKRSSREAAHKRILSGIHSGDSAIGSYGLMPNTVKEIAKRAALEKSSPKDLEQISYMDNDQIKEFLLENENIEKDFAQNLARRLLKKHNKDLEKTAYAWNMGHNLSSEEIERRDYKNHPYTKKFKKLLEELKKSEEK